MCIYLSIGTVLLLFGVLLLSFYSWRLRREVHAMEHTVRFMEQEARAMEQLACSHPVSGLPNGRALEEHADKLFASLRRGMLQEVALAFIDLDHFKQVNDTHGHHVGDELLTRVGRALQANVRASDISAHLYGDEFVILMPYTERAEPETVLARVGTALEGVLQQYGAGYTAGVVTTRDGYDSFASLLQAADTSMNKQKELKGNHR